MKAFVFVLLMIMPDGEPKHISAVVASCPAEEMIEALYEDMRVQGEIKDWNAVCFRFETRGAE